MFIKTLNDRPNQEGFTTMLYYCFIYINTSGMVSSKKVFLVSTLERSFLYFFYNFIYKVIKPRKNVRNALRFIYFICRIWFHGGNSLVILFILKLSIMRNFSRSHPLLYYNIITSKYIRIIYNIFHTKKRFIRINVQMYIICIL